MPPVAGLPAGGEVALAPVPVDRGALWWPAERDMVRAGGGQVLDTRAVWPLGLLVAGAALGAGGSVEEITGLARQIAAHPDRRASRTPSPGPAVSVRYGTAGAKGEARAGFAHVRRALAALDAARRDGDREPQAHTKALLAVMTTLQDTGLPAAALSLDRLRGQDVPVWVSSGSTPIVSVATTPSAIFPFGYLRTSRPPSAPLPG